MIKHTSGPWNLQLGTAGDWRVDRAASEWNICGRLSTVEHMEKESLANAHLIAAAPDLLEALGNCLSLVELKFGNTDPTGNAAIAQARAAIAKAKAKAKAKGEDQ